MPAKKITITLTEKQAWTLYAALRNISDSRDDLNPYVMTNVNAMGKQVAAQIGVKWVINNKGTW